MLIAKHRAMDRDGAEEIKRLNVNHAPDKVKIDKIQSGIDTRAPLYKHLEDGAISSYMIYTEAVFAGCWKNELCTIRNDIPFT